jgi:hypothetical protein
MRQAFPAGKRGTDGRLRASVVNGQLVTLLGNARWVSQSVHPDRRKPGRGRATVRCGWQLDAGWHLDLLLRR